MVVGVWSRLRRGVLAEIHFTDEISTSWNQRVAVRHSSLVEARGLEYIQVRRRRRRKWSENVFRGRFWRNGGRSARRSGQQ